MSAIGGPNIGKEALNTVVFSFSPEENGLSQNGIFAGAPVPLPKSSFNVTTSSLSPYYSPSTDPSFLNDGWWSQTGRLLFDANVIANAPNQRGSLYTSYLNNNIAFGNLQYTIPHPVNDNFLGDGVTICGFINVDRFPRISLDIKKKLGVIRFEYNRPEGGNSFNLGPTGIGLMRVGVRKANSSSKYAFGFHASFFSNLSLSIMTDYQYDINKWYFYSVHFKYSGPSTQTIDVSLSINGETVTTHTDISFAFFNKQIVRNDPNRQGGTDKNSSYPINSNFLNNAGVISTGVRATTHSIPLVTGFKTSYGSWRNNINDIVQYTNLLKNTSSMIVSFLTLHKSTQFGGLHDNIKIGQHFIFNQYNIDDKKIYYSYKTLYL